MSLKIDALILAAGSSSRMGEPKQLLNYQGKTFVEHVCDQAIASDVRHVHLVLGAYHDQIIPLVQDKSLDFHINPDWEKGMGNSIAFGVTSLLKHDESPNAILVLLVDQPMITTHDMNTIIKIFIDKGNVVVSQRDESISPPTLLTTNHFEALMDLNSDVGAKKYLLTMGTRLDKVDLGDRTIDIDTKTTYHRLK